LYGGQIYGLGYWLVQGLGTEGALTMEGPQVVVAQVHQVLQGGVKLLHDALYPRAREAGHEREKKDR
jgi:hypothetical protein